jgi:hypothetical protein
MQDEAVKHNMGLSADNRAKNFMWAVVGCKAEKRLVRRITGGQYENDKGEKTASTQKQQAGRMEDDGADTDALPAATHL